MSASSRSPTPVDQPHAAPLPQAAPMRENFAARGGHKSQPGVTPLAHNAFEKFS
jgi:hypothetical protein